MKAREKILVAGMIVALCYAAVALMDSGKGRKRRRKASAVTAIADNFSSVKISLKSQALAEPERMVLKLAEETASANPMIEGLTPEEQKKEKERLERERRKQIGSVSAVRPKSSAKGGASLIIYSGHFKDDDTQVAVINNEDLVVGQALQGTDLILKTIEDKRVILSDMKTGKIVVVKFSE